MKHKPGAIKESKDRRSQVRAQLNRTAPRDRWGRIQANPLPQCPSCGHYHS